MWVNMNQLGVKTYFVISQGCTNLFLDLRQYLYYNNSEDKIKHQNLIEHKIVVTDSR